MARYYTGHSFPLVKDFGEKEVFLAPADCSVTVEGDRVSSYYTISTGTAS
jgi:hypothetical protein